MLELQRRDIEKESMRIIKKIPTEPREIRMQILMKSIRNFRKNSTFKRTNIYRENKTRARHEYSHPKM